MDSLGYTGDASRLVKHATAFPTQQYSNVVDGIVPRSPPIVAGKKMVSNDGSLTWVVGGTPAELKSGVHMREVRKKAMESYLQLSKKKRSKITTPVDRSRSTVEAGSPPLPVHKIFEEQEIEDIRISNRIAQQNYFKNFKTMLEELEKDGLSELSENSNDRESHDFSSAMNPDSEGTAWPEDSLGSVDENPPCNTLYIGNLPSYTSEDELRSLFISHVGYKRMCFRTKQSGLMCFVEFDNTQLASEALQYYQGYRLANSTDEGIKISYSKNSLGVRSENIANESLTKPLQAKPDGDRKFIDCVCGVPNEEDFLFRCENCDRWQHVRCYHDVIVSKGELHECTECSLKRREEHKSYRPHNAGFKFVTANTPDAFSSKSSLTLANNTATNSFSKRRQHQAHLLEGILPPPPIVLRPMNSMLHPYDRSPAPLLRTFSLPVGPWQDLSYDQKAAMAQQLRPLYQVPYSKISLAQTSALVKTKPSDSFQRMISDGKILDSHKTENDVQATPKYLKSKDGTNDKNNAIACQCGSIAEVDPQSHMFPELGNSLEEDWNLIQSQLPNEWKWDIEYYNGCWTCTPLDTNELKSYPLTIAGSPVVLPVEYQWPPIGGVHPPPDPRPSFPIDCRAELPPEVKRDLFLTFEGSIGFYLLVNGLLQVIVPENFDTSWASSHLPQKYGGLKVCYIPQNIEPTMLPSTTQISDADPGITAFTSTTVNIHMPERALHSSWSDSFDLNDFIEARPKSKKNRKEKYSGRIGLSRQRR